MSQGVFFSLVLFFLAVAPAAARDIYVNNVDGDDLLDGSISQRRGVFEGPVRTIRRALRLAGKSDRVIIANAGKPYRESVSLSTGRHTGDRQRPFTIVGNGAVLDGSLPVPNAAWEHYRDDVFRFRPSWLGNPVVLLNDRPAKRRPDAIRHRRKPLLEPLEWEAYGAYIYFCVEKIRRPEDYAISHAVRPCGITLYQVHDVRIENLFVQHFRIDGIHVNDGVRRCELIQITARGNGRSGIFVGGASYEIVVRRCLIGDNSTAQLLLRGFSQTEVLQSELLKASAPPIVRQGKAEVKIVPIKAEAGQ